jgi:hypothetical protein
VRSAALCAALLAAGLVVALPVRCMAPAAVAGDDKEDEKKKKEEERRKAEKEKREKTLRDVASSFSAKNSTDLLQRVPKDAKITLALGADNGDYAVDQAKGVLNKFFDDQQNISVDLKEMKADGNDASFPISVRRKGEKKEKKGKLRVTVGAADATPKYPLVKLAVDL